MHSNNIDKCGKSPQSARRKSNYHTKYGKSCYKILVYSFDFRLISTSLI